MDLHNLKFRNKFTAMEQELSENKKGFFFWLKKIWVDTFFWCLSPSDKQIFS
jgi:hypothetical protein